MDKHPITRLGATLLLGLFTLTGVAAQGFDADPELESWRGEQAVRGELLVVFDAQVDDTSRRATHEILGSTLLGPVGGRFDRVALPTGADLDNWVQNYRARAGVVEALPNLVVPALNGVPSDPKWNQQWGLSKVRAAEAWPGAAGDPSCVVAIIDSGLDVDHADLDDKLAWAWDFYANDADPTDLDGHGTHCAGVAAAETDNAIGIAGAAGACRFAAYRAGNASFPTNALVNSIDDAVAQGAHVISMSWGSSYNNPLIKSALEDARDAGCVLVAAAGNNGVSSKFYPAGLSFVLAVASSSHSDARSSFSNYGDWVAVAAPGQGILSASKNGGYVSMSGTSMACPLVAGLATLLYSRLGTQRSVASAVAVKQAMQDSAVDVGNWVQHGRIDFPGAVAQLTSPGPLAPQSVSPSHVAAAGGETVLVTGSGMLGVSAVNLGGVSVDTFSVLDDATLSFEAPRVHDLGPQSLTLTKDGVLSSALFLTLGEAHPPQLALPTSASVGSLLSFDMGGRSNDQWLLLVSLSPQSIPFKGTQLLYPFSILSGGALDAAGLAELTLAVPALVGGLDVSAQLVTLDGGFVGASSLRTVSFTP